MKNSVSTLMGSAVVAAIITSCTQADQAKIIPSVQPCADIKGVSAVLDNPLPKVIVLGELHGLTASPDFAQALVCHSLARGNRTALGFEYEDDEDGSFETFLASDGQETAKAALFKHSMFQSAMTDGRSSDAMLGLLDYARLTSGREDFTQFFFTGNDLPLELYQEDRNQYFTRNEKSYADNILSVATSGTVDKTIVLVGSMHARRSTNTFGDNNYPFMAAYLPAPDTMTLLNLYTSGTSWNCQGAEDGGHSCGENETSGYIDPESELAKTDSYEIFIQPDIRLTQAATDPIKDAVTDGFGDSYDALFFVGAAVASPPASADGRKSD